MEERVTLNRKEQARLMVLNEVEKGRMTAGQAAAVMGMSLRNTRRLLAAYRARGVAGLAHGNRGRKPSNAIEGEIRRQVVELASTRYSRFNQQHFSESLAEHEGISISRSSVRDILLQSGVRSPRTRRPPRHRSRRERYAQEGMLLQVDGSPHDWLEGRGPSLCLIGAIDDATGKAPYALFRKQEDSQGYFMLLRQIVGRYGIPLAVYHDRHSIFQVSDREPETIREQLAGKPRLTQFGRLLEELGIESISANSPQAKGRIERLWGTFQDRLVSELRLAEVSTLEDANHFLDGFLVRFNTRFAVPPECPGAAYRKAEGLDVDTVFCFKHERVVGADNVVRYNGQRLQVLPSLERLSYARCTVEVHEHFDGTLKVSHQGRYLDTCTAPPEATKARELVSVPRHQRSVTTRRINRPAQDHPWRQWVYR